MNEELLLGFLSAVYEELKQIKLVEEKQLDVLMMVLKHQSEDDLEVVNAVHNRLNLLMTDDWQSEYYKPEEE